jgi:hypothetical protein
MQPYGGELRSSLPSLALHIRYEIIESLNTLHRSTYTSFCRFPLDRRFSAPHFRFREIGVVIQQHCLDQHNHGYSILVQSTTFRNANVCSSPIKPLLVWFLCLQANDLLGHLFLVLGFGKRQILTETQALNAET